MPDAQYCARCRAKCARPFVRDEYEELPGGGIRIVRRNAAYPRRRRLRRNPGGPNVNLMLGIGAIAVGGWLLFRTPAGGGPSLWQSLTGPSYPNPNIVTVPGIGTVGGSVIGSIGTTIAEWIGGLAA